MCDKAAIYDRLKSQAGHPAVPIFMRHGAADDFILPSWGLATSKKLSSLGMDVNWGVIPGLAHALDDREVEDLTAWLWSNLRVEEDDDASAPACSS